MVKELEEIITMHHFGLDFGTNYISASYVNPASGKPEPVRFMDNGQEKMPALVYYSEYGVLVGQGVQSQLEQLSTFPPRERLQAQQAIVRSLKRGLNPSGAHIVPGKGAVSHVDVVTDIMTFVKQDVEAGCFSGEKVEKLTLTHPVVCTEAYKKLLKTAAEKAGFKQVDLMEEPVAAAMGYASSGLDVGRGILVYDFGGGTFDVAFVMRDDNGQFHIPIAPLGDPWCGGDDLDMRLYEYWDRKAQEEKGRSINGSAGEVDAGFLFRCRRHKETLSRMEKMAFTEYLPPQDGVLNPEENKLTVTLDRNIAKQLFMNDVGRTIDITKRMLSSVKNDGYKVDTVILIGGSSRLPMVKDLLKDILPVKPLETMHVDVAVAMGSVWETTPKIQHEPKPQSNATPRQKSKSKPEQDLDNLSKLINPVTPHSKPKSELVSQLILHLKERIAVTEPSTKSVKFETDTALQPGMTWKEPVTGMEFMAVPGGEYSMGEVGGFARAKMNFVHPVKISDFWMGKYPVTQGEWERIMGNNPSKFKKGDKYPVENVSWYATKEFIKKLIESSGNMFRLPTEAEWEYAARSGGRQEKYSGSDNLDEVAWYIDYSKWFGRCLIQSFITASTHPVGMKNPNGLGLYDMSGNVSEWCEDIYAKDAYLRHSFDNPVNTSEGSSRVLRGGSWNSGDYACESTFRMFHSPDYRYKEIGFRLVLSAI